ncbi:MAG: DUF3426 domain-containing protein [Geminicoccaceae bacterium]
MFNFRENGARFPHKHVMILTCSHCSIRYHVDPDSLGREGRVVRCAQCGHRWKAEPPSDAPKLLELAQLAPSGAARPGAAARPPHTVGSAALVGWLASILVVLLLVSAVVGRDRIVAGFPASASIYQKLGLPVTAQLGLAFEGVTSQRLVEGGISVLVVEGAIVNPSKQDRTVPPIKVTLLDGGGRRLQDELFAAKEQEVEAGGRTSFSGRLINPARQARNFSVSFEVQ